MQTWIRWLLTALLCTPAAAQADLWVIDDDVGPGVDFATVQAGVDAAQSGDALLIRDGHYVETVKVTAKSLLVIAEPGAVIEHSSGVTVPAIEVSDLGAGQCVTVLGGQFLGPDPTAAQAPAIAVTNCAGPVWCEGVDGYGRFGLEAVDSPFTAVIGSALEGTPSTGLFLPAMGDALRASGTATAFVFDSALIGAVGVGSGCTPGIGCQPAPANGGHGARLRDAARLAAFGSLVQGGFGGNGQFDCAPNWAPGGGGDGGNAVFLDGPRAGAALFDCELIAGLGGDGSCVGMDAELVAGPGSSWVTSGEARSLSSTTPVREGETVALVFSGVPGDFVFGLAAPSPLLLELVGFVGPLAVAAPILIQPIGRLPASGTFELTWTVDTLPPELEVLVRYLQGLFVSTSGDLFLSAPTALVVLDETF